MILTRPLTRTPGFQAAGVTCGLKASGNKDLALIVADRACTWSAVFTTNTFQSAPVLYDKARWPAPGAMGFAPFSSTLESLTLLPASKDCATPK